MGVDCMTRENSNLRMEGVFTDSEDTLPEP
jgi:hypothetical protein